MIDELPWDRNSKAQVPGGWAYPLGRDAIADALRDAGATLGSLGLWGSGLPPSEGPTAVLRVEWMSDALPGYHGATAGGRQRLHMSLYAVPAVLRSAIGRQLVDGPLQDACRWATAALTRGNVWSAGWRTFAVTHVHEELFVSES